MFFWVVARVLQENARGLYTKVMRVSRVCLRAGRILDQHFMPRRTFQDPQDTHLFPGHRHVVLFYLHAHGTPTAKLLVQNNPCRTDPGDRSRAILVFSVQGGVIWFRPGCVGTVFGHSYESSWNQVAFLASIARATTTKATVLGVGAAFHGGKLHNDIIQHIPCPG